MKYDTIIIGGGPSGLIALNYLVKKKYNVLLIEKGKSWDRRNRRDLFTVSSGLGGAGLYSDGKFSFYPSATNLWKLNNSQFLEESYIVFKNLLEDINKSIPNFDFTWLKETNNRANRIEKRYYSLKTTDNERREILQNLLSSIPDNRIIIESEVTEIDYKDNEFCLTAKSDNQRKYYSAQSVILALGKTGPIFFENNFPDENKVFRKYEIGIRLQTNSAHFDYYNDDQIDKKIIKPISNINDTELRTFCCCRDGKVIYSELNNVISINGYSDGNKTNLSNIGINVRINKPSDSNIYSEFVSLFQKKPIKFNTSLTHFISNCERYNIGKILCNLIINFVKDYFPKTLENDSSIYGISYEGFGYYPEINNDLKVTSMPLWITGDTTGLFRGLTAAFLSGTYAAKDVEKYFEIKKMKRKVNLKQSSTQDMGTVFTAMSKNYFYCRDSVCEYVFNKGFLPLNPFRIFDYFLSDRVDRDIIRQSNNKLISLADEIWVFGHISDGVLFEIHLAHKYDKPIKFFNINSIASHIKPISPNDIRFEPEVHAKRITKESLLNFIKNNISELETDQLELGLGD